MAPRTVPEWVKKAKRNQAAGLKHGFRSGLEVKLGQQIQAATGKPPKYEVFKIPYMVPETRHHYTPDFPLPNGIVIEGKGIFDSTDRAKHLFVQAQYPELDIRFVFSNAQAKINKGSKTTYAMWCEAHGIKWAHKEIPSEWFKEKGPKRSPQAVIADGPYGYANKTKEERNG